MFGVNMQCVPYLQGLPIPNQILSAAINIEVFIAANAENGLDENFFTAQSMYLMKT